MCWARYKELSRVIKAKFRSETEVREKRGLIKGAATKTKAQEYEKEFSMHCMSGPLWVSVPIWALFSVSVSVLVAVS